MTRHTLHNLFLRLIFGVLCSAVCFGASAGDRVRIIVDGAERSTNAQIVRSIAALVAKPADIEFDLRHSVGPADTLMQLRDGSGQQFAVLQADVAESFLGAAARGNVKAGQLLAPIRAIAQVSEEDIYFLVRSDSPLNYVHEIEGARINLGVLNGSTALTVATIYRLMFNAAIPEKQTSFDTQQNALVKLTEQAVDVVVVVAPRPARLLAEMKPEARRFVKFLKFDQGHPDARRTLNVYTARTIPATQYPNLLDADLSTLAVRIYLVSYGRNDALQARLANSWCQNLPRLREEGHLALRGLPLALPPLASGWYYSRPFESELNACMEGKRAQPASCTQEDRALGLCT